MHALLHIIGTLVVLPYLLLAVAFLLIGDIARTRGLLAIIDTIANHANWILRWGLYGLPVIALAFMAFGLIPSLQRSCAAVLFLVALGSLGIICWLHSGRLELGQIVFLLPCVAVIAMSAWLFNRAATPQVGSSAPAEMSSNQQPVE